MHPHATTKRRFRRGFAIRGVSAPARLLPASGSIVRTLELQQAEPAWRIGMSALASNLRATLSMIGSASGSQLLSAPSGSSLAGAYAGHGCGGAVSSAKDKERRRATQRFPWHATGARRPLLLAEYSAGRCSREAGAPSASAFSSERARARKMRDRGVPSELPRVKSFAEVVDKPLIIAHKQVKLLPA